MSLARRAWIEIQEGCSPGRRATMSLARRAWIEMDNSGPSYGKHYRCRLRVERGLKWE